jgi:hypothetical protein
VGDASPLKFLLVILGFIKSYHMFHTEIFEYFKVILRPEAMFWLTRFVINRALKR